MEEEEDDTDNKRDSGMGTDGVIPRGLNIKFFLFSMILIVLSK